MQVQETSSPVLLGRECKGVVVVAAVVEAALPGARAAAPAATQEQPTVVCGQCLSRALRQVVATSVGQGGVEVEVVAAVVVAAVVVAAVVVDVGLGAHLDHH